MGICQTDEISNAETKLSCNTLKICCVLKIRKKKTMDLGNGYANYSGSQYTQLATLVTCCMRIPLFCMQRKLQFYTVCERNNNMLPYTNLIHMYLQFTYSDIYKYILVQTQNI